MIENIFIIGLIILTFIPAFLISIEMKKQIVKKMHEDYEETRNGITYHYKDPSDKL